MVILINPEEFHKDPKNSEKAAILRMKTPRRVLHFSDGVLEEYSDDELLASDENKPSQTVVDPATLTWGPWLWYKAWIAGSSTMSFIDYLGESLASFFGITTPRFYFELEEYKRREAMTKSEQEQARGWSEHSGMRDIQLKDMTTQPQPQPIPV